VRWRRLTLLAQGTLPDVLLLEDAEDLARWFVALNRTVPRSWSEEVAAAAMAAHFEGMF